MTHLSMLLTMRTYTRTLVTIMMRKGRKVGIIWTAMKLVIFMLLSFSPSIRS